MLYSYFKKRITATLVLMLLAISISQAAMQDTTAAPTNTRPGAISGTVVDDDAHPLQGVKVAVRGGTAVAETNSEGEFEIDAAAGDRLVFTFPNFNSREIAVKNATPLDVKLISTYIQNPDTIDVLYGRAGKQNIVGSVSTIYTNQLTTTPASLYTYALPGQLAGLYTMQTSGFTVPVGGALQNSSGNVNVSSHNLVATDNSEIALSLRGQIPVTIVNGIQREISGLDPESIESVSVLKDGLSTILLGTNSSRGVLLITTKKAEIGKPRISFTAQTGMQQSLGVSGNVLPAYQWAYLYNESLLNDGKAAVYKKADFNAYRDGSDPIGHPDVNWFNTILKDNSPITSYKLNVSGGTQITRYQIGLSYLNQGGIFETAADVPYNTNNNLSRYILNTNMSVNVTKNLEVDLQMFARIQNSTQPGTGIASIMRSLYLTPSNAYPIYNEDGSFGGSNAGGTNGPFSNNLLAQAQYSGYLKNTSKDVLVNLDLNYDLNSLLEGLSATARGNISIQSVNLLDRSLISSAFTFVPSDGVYSPVNTPRAQSNSYTNSFTSRYVFAQGALNYNRQFDKHGINAMLMTDMRSVTLNYDLSAVTVNRALKAAYNYDGKYFAEAAVNNSGYNRYPPGNQNNFYYAFGLGWQMAKETFIRDHFSWIDGWKWRATYGRTGNNNVDRYQYYGYLQTYSSSIKGYGVGVNKSLVFSFNEDALASQFIRAEKGDKLDIGADITLFNNHLDIKADYYHDKYSDLLGVRGKSILLIGANPPNVTTNNITAAGNGSIYPVENIGTTLFTGTELTLTYKNNVRNFNYFISANGSVQSSKILYMDEEFRAYEWNKRTGQPVNTIFGYQALGFFQSAEEAAASPTLLGYTPQAGDVKYADLNDDGVIDQFDETAIGGTKPLMFYGVSLGFNYKGFSVSVLLQGVTNRDIYTYNSTVNGFTGLGNSGSAPFGQAYETSLSRWTAETAATATLPRLTFSNVNNSQISSLYMSSGNYFRVKNAEIGYNIPFSLCKQLSVSGIRVFANGQNLFTITGYKGFDPEVYPNNIPGTYAYPIQRVFNAGVTVKL